MIGNGVVTVRRDGRSRTFPSGSRFSLDLLGALLAGVDSGGGRAAPASVDTSDEPAPPATEAAGAPTVSLRAEAEAARARFDVSAAAGDVDGCVTAVLDLEAAIVAWNADTNQSDDGDRARRTLRALVVELGELARAGVRDPTTVIAPFVEALLELRTRARAAKDFATSDVVRDRLTTVGVQVRDTTEGTRWSL